jgi:hypothetical protein
MEKLRIWDYEAIAMGPELKGEIQDVPDTGIRPNETNLEYLFRMLLKQLQTLAADTDTMLRAYPSNCAAIDELVSDFSHYLECTKELIEERLVEEEFFRGARVLENRIFELSERRDPKYWTDEALRHGPEWVEIRRLAKEALASMGYDLEPPPPRSM